MRIAVIANNIMKEELLAQGLAEDISIVWQDQISAIAEVDCYIDLLYISTPERTEKLKELLPAIIIINAVSTTLENLPDNFIRINGWPGFLKRSIVEAACNHPTTKIIAEKVFTYFNKKIEWTPDVVGFITARIISMIINEAWFAFEEEVSTQQEIDTAMKLGTNYPYGPFEWGEKIGLEKIYSLLTELAKINSRYEPATLLKKQLIA